MRQKFELIEPTDGVVADLVTLAALKLELGTPDSEDEANDARITRESLLIAEACDRTFGFAEATERFEFDTNEVTRPGQVLQLSLYPNVEIDSIEVDGVALGEADFVLDAERGRIWRPGASWSGTNIVTYSGGYDLPEGAPGGLQAACIEAVRGRRMSLSRDPSVREVSHGDTSVGYFSEELTAGALSASVLALIKPFRRLAV